MKAPGYTSVSGQVSLDQAITARLLTVSLAILALVAPQSGSISAQSSTVRRVNAPYFVGEIPFAETAIFWFGRVQQAENYADMRVGYNDAELYVRLAAFDRYAWYDTSPTPGELSAWDAATLYLSLDGNAGSTPDSDAYRFVGQLNWWEARADYQVAYRGSGSAWMTATVPFSTTSGWRGDAPNNTGEDRGWALTFHVPFASLGLSGPPPPGSVWGMGMALHDRDDEGGTPITDKVWPETLDALAPSSWAQLAFGLPANALEPAVFRGSATIREGLDGAVIPDAAVGGTIGNLCPGGSYHIWNEWGSRNYSATASFNIQNQSDVADWPCFAKYYVTFPLDSIPPGQVIISATLTLHQFGGSDPSQAQPSLVQVSTVNEDWDEANITWNNGPLAGENVGQAWVDPLPEFPGWPGAARTWDVSLAVARAYTATAPLRLALYEADSAYHSGKHFVASETGDWNAAARPTLNVWWGEPAKARIYMPMVMKM